METRDVFGPNEAVACVFLALPMLVIGAMRVRRGWRSGAPIMGAAVASMALWSGAIALARSAAPVPPSARVECLPAGLYISDGYQCQVSHTAGGKLRTCWTIAIRCVNGRELEAHACESLSPGERASVLATVQGAATCDRVASIKMPNVEVVPLN